MCTSVGRFLGPILLVLAALPATAAAPSSLVRIDRGIDVDRNQLISSGIHLVAELPDGYLALGDPSIISSVLATWGLDLAVVDANPERSRFALAGLLPGGTEADLEACGELVWREDDWFLLRAFAFDLAACATPRAVVTPLTLDPLAPTKAPAAAYQSFGDGEPELLDTDPLVVDMLAVVDESFAMSHWQGVVDMASTRYSTSTGCQTAAEEVYALFDLYGLQPYYQHHTSGHAPNVVGTLPGQIDPEHVVIVIGHLDDLPSSGSAPGADDNASGSAMVTALAEVMSEYDYAKTLRFIAVTGEEFGLYGSYFHAAQAAAAGDDIQAVLNGDMIGWQGNGSPNPEDLDVNFNTGSAWLGTLMQQVAADYPTGAVVNAFECNSMAYSDHWPFWQQGWSAICGITDNEGFCGQSGNYPYYHTSGDTIANCGPGAPAFMASALRLYLATAGHIADPLCRRTEAPTGVSAVPAGDNQIDVSWGSAGSGLSYEVYRAPGGCADPGPTTLVGATSNLFLSDTTASGGVLYGYTVLSQDPTGYCLSEPSTCVEVLTTGDCTEPPSFAGVTTVADGGDSTCLLTVGWGSPDAVYCGGDVAYNIYRSSTPGFEPGPANRIAELLTGTSFEDYDVDFGNDYYYVVRAVDLSNGAEDVNTVEIPASPTGPAVIGDWLDDAGDTGAAGLTPTSPWTVHATGGNTGPMVYATGDYTNNTCAGVTTGPLQLGVNPQLSFWSKFDIESNWDKGQVEISTNDGATWLRVPVNYPNYANRTADSCDWPTGDFFTGTNLSYALYTASLNQWSNQEVLLRWAISTDTSVNGTGWWVDDIAVTNVSVPGECTPSQTQLPGAFGKLEPADGAVDQPLTLDFFWEESAGATGYRFCMDTTDDGSCAPWTDVGSFLMVQVPGLDTNTTYYWQVEAVNGGGATLADGGAWWSLVTQSNLFADGFESGDTTGWSATIP